MDNVFLGGWTKKMTEEEVRYSEGFDDGFINGEEIGKEEGAKSKEIECYKEELNFLKSGAYESSRGRKGRQTYLKSKLEEQKKHSGDKNESK